MNADTEVGSTELASILGVTARRVQQMAQDGTITAVRRGRFNLSDSVQRYITFISKSDISADEKETEKKKLAAEALYKRSKARIAEMEADELDGKMHRSEDVAALTSDLVFSVRGMLMALPGRLAVDVIAAGSAAAAAEIIKKEIYFVLNELSRYKYDPRQYKERARSRREWDYSEKDETGNASSENKEA
ncbi:MAG: hypothetical protein IKL10_04790 [Clostridia bacterium]|nr:hypothetical protein [Clostridia bacterium]